MRCSLFAACCLLSSVRYVLLVGCCALWCVLLVAGLMLVRGSLVAVCCRCGCLLFVGA